MKFISQLAIFSTAVCSIKGGFLNFQMTKSSSNICEKEENLFVPTIRIRGGDSFDQVSLRSELSVGRDRELFHASIGKY